jgi:ATP-dependent 26S proteasome regulatory subunit
MNGHFNNGYSNGYMGSGTGSITDMIKSNLMTMMMFKNINTFSSSTNSGGGGGLFDVVNILYVFLFSQLIEQFIKYMPQITCYVTNKIYLKFIERLDDMNITNLNDIDMKDTSDKNKIKVKTSSIKININITDHENIIGQALLDYITNHPNTKYVSYIKQNFILNQRDVIQIDEDVFTIMKDQIVDSSDKTQPESSTNTNINNQDFNFMNTSKKAGQTNNSNTNSSGNIEQIIEVYSFTKTVDELRDFLNKIRHNYSIKIKNKLEGKTYYFNMFPVSAPIMQDGIKDYTKLPPNFIFTMKHFQTNRHFENLFGDEIERIRNRVQFFTKNRKWYDKKGIPYTLGLLLSGKPGAGKTSTIKCLANETKRHIININLNNDITKTQLENLFFNEMVIVLNPSTQQNEKYYIPLDERVYVLEDIDCQSDIILDRSIKMNNDMETQQHRNTTTQKDNVKELTRQQLSANKLDLSFLLNLLDGVLETPGRILIMTSNYPQLLDKALVRPGRVDVIAHFDNCTHSTILKMMEFFYDMKLSEKDIEDIMSLEELLFSPAEVSKVMFENIENYKQVIKTLKEECCKKRLETTHKIEDKNANNNDNNKRVEKVESSISLYEGTEPISYLSYSNTKGMTYFSGHDDSEIKNFTYIDDLNSFIQTDKKEDYLLKSLQNIDKRYR